MEKKILILAESLKIGGGTESVAVSLGNKLYDKGYEVSYLTLMDLNPKYHFKGDYYTLNLDKNIYGNSLRLGLNLLRYSGKIKKICDNLKIDIIISFAEASNFYAVMSRWMFKNKARIVVTQHMNPSIHLYSKLKANTINFFYTHADYTVCVSRDIEKILNEKFGVKNTVTIYNMMNLRENIRLSQEPIPNECEHVFDNENFNFITVGRLTRQKGQWFLIRSFQKVVDKHPNSRLFIIGEGDLNTELKTLINSLHLNKHVFLLGRHENIFPFLKNSNCFILTSLWEGFGLVLIEALSLNLPVISSDCKSGPREVLCPELDLTEKISYPYFGKYGILTDLFPDKLIFKDIKQIPFIKEELMLIDLMIEMIENPKLRKNYSHGQNLDKTFDDDKIIDQWTKIFKY